MNHLNLTLPLILLLTLLWTTVGFLLHHQTMRHTDDISWRNSPRLSLYIRAWFWELCFNTLVVFIYPLGWLPSLSRRRAFFPHAGPPIVLLPGYAMNKAYFVVLVWRLHRRGYRNVHALNFWPLFGNMEAMATRLAHDIRDISTRADGRPVHIIAHSMGGLVMRWCLQTEPTLPIAQVLTLGSPHAGTTLARFGIGKNGAQLRRSSNFLQALTHPRSVPFVSIYTVLDTIVLPPHSACFADDAGVKHVRFDHCAHNTLVFDRRVAEIVMQHLPVPDQIEFVAR